MLPLSQYSSSDGQPTIIAGSRVAVPNQDINDRDVVNTHQRVLRHESLQDIVPNTALSLTLPSPSLPPSLSLSTRLPPTERL